MSTNVYDSVRSAVAMAEEAAERAQLEAEREYRELGLSLTIANAERQRLNLMLEAALDLLAERVYRRRSTAELAVCSRVQEIGS